MKKLVSLLFIFTMIFTLVSCDSPPETSYAGEKKAYTEKIKGDGTVEYRWYYRYDPNGEISTSSRCNANGLCVQRETFTYNESNDVLSKTIYISNEAGTATKKVSYTEYIYSDDGKLCKEITNLPNEYKETVYEYNADGNISASKDYNLAGEIIGTKQYIYDSLKNLTNENFYDGNSNYLGGIVYTYKDSKLSSKKYDGNQISEITETDAKGEITKSFLISKEEYYYDGENVTKTFFYDIEGNRIYTETAEYDGDRCMHRMRVDASNAIIFTWNAYYDSFMSLIG